MFLTEWMAEWIADSEGAFPMSLLEACRDLKVIPKYARDPKEDKGKEFIFGIDIARERDSTAICVVELGFPSKVVFIAELEDKPFQEQAKYIFSLVEKFNPVMIYMDEFGGGQTIRDHLTDPESVGWPKTHKIVSTEETVNHSGRRILKLCNFNPGFIEDANNSAKTLLEQGMLKLPHATHPIEGFRKGAGKQMKEVDLVEEMINQIASVVVTPTSTGRLHYDLPKSLSSSLNFNVRKKDLYTSFILAGKCAYDLLWKVKADNIIVDKGIITEIKREPILTTDNYSSIISSDRLAGIKDSTIYTTDQKVVIPGNGIIFSRNVKTRR